LFRDFPNMSTVTVVAKKKATPKGSKRVQPEPEGDDQVRIRMSHEFKAWVQRYAEFRHLSMTDTFIQAIIREAKAEGFDPPPKR
jgi:hypothetical protein